MPYERDETAIADNILRFLDVVTAEWRSMRQSLVTVAPVPGDIGFGQCRRVEWLDIPEPTAGGEAAHAAADPPPALRLATLERARYELAATLPRLRFAATPLDATPLTECVRLLLSPFAPPARGGKLAIVAPEDDEAGRMMARGFWLRDLPAGWSVPTADASSFRELAREALALLAEDPVAGSLVRRSLASVVLVNYPRTSGVCTASATHLWVSPSRCRDVRHLADLLLSGAVHGALYVNEALHAKWAADPSTLDATRVTVPFHGAQRQLEYDTAFHGVHVEYARWRHGVDGSGVPVTDGPALRQSIAALLAHRQLLTDHGAQMLNDLDRCCASPLPV